MDREDLQELSRGRLEKQKRDTLQTIHDSLRPVTVSDCIDCGDPIDEERREAMPSATRCIDCQARHEIERGRKG